MRKVYSFSTLWKSWVLVPVPHKNSYEGVFHEGIGSTFQAQRLGVLRLEIFRSKGSGL